MGDDSHGYKHCTGESSRDRHHQSSSSTVINMESIPNELLQQIVQKVKEELREELTEEINKEEL
jgi:hypothetical protein